jgi:dihydroxy-acid dehydratase
MDCATGRHAARLHATLCSERNIVIGLMTDARFSGGSGGLVVGHVGPEAALGGPVALIEDGDEVVVDLDGSELNCPAHRRCRDACQTQGGLGQGGRRQRWSPFPLHRARTTSMLATRGGGLHSDREVWVLEPRRADRSGFKLRNKYQPHTSKSYRSRASRWRLGVGR